VIIAINRRSETLGAHLSEVVPERSSYRTLPRKQSWTPACSIQQEDVSMIVTMQCIVVILNCSYLEISKYEGSDCPISQ
jgi:hypothetical protein